MLQKYFIRVISHFHITYFLLFYYIMVFSFLRPTRSIERISCCNVSVCLSGWVAVYHSRYCIKMTKPVLKLFGPFGRPIIKAFGTHCADTKFQGEPLHRGLYIHGDRKNWRFSMEMADISETVRDTTMVTMER